MMRALSEGSEPSMHSSESPSRRYKLLGKIASGGMGVVYLGTHRADAGFSRLIAVKLIHEHLAEDRKFVDMFLDEARLAGRLSHPCVVGILDVGKTDGRYYIVMPYIEGGTLSELLRRSRADRDPAFIVPLVIDALNGLDAAHTLTDDLGEPLALVHRDICPANILVGVDGIGRVTDFGIAKAAARITQTAPGILKGKLSYMAPEQATGGAVDARADVFSMGVVLWSALTGRPLFRGEHDAATMKNVLEMAAPPPSTVGLAPPACLDEVCLRALEKDPDKRFQSAAEMAEALREAALAGNLCAPVTRISRWVQEVFAERLAHRREAISRAMKAAPEATGPARRNPPSIELSSDEPSASSMNGDSAPAVVAEQAQAAQVDVREPRRWLAAALVAAAGALGVAVAALLGGGASTTVSDAIAVPAAKLTEPRAPAVVLPSQAPEHLDIKPDPTSEDEAALTKREERAPTADDEAATAARADREEQTGESGDSSATKRESQRRTVSRPRRPPPKPARERLPNKSSEPAEEQNRPAHNEKKKPVLFPIEENPYVQ